jgi:hypothetical protein
MVVLPGAGLKNCPSIRVIQAYAGGSVNCSGAILSSANFTGIISTQAAAIKNSYINCSATEIDLIVAQLSSQVMADGATLTPLPFYGGWGALWAVTGSRISAEGATIQPKSDTGTFTGAAVRAEGGSHIDFDGGVIDTTYDQLDRALEAIDGSVISANGVDCSNNDNTSGASDINVSNGSTINANGTTGTVNQTVNVITSDGLIYR